MWPRRAALVLALFFGSFTNVYGHFSVLGDLFPGFLTWGYVFSVLGLAAMVWALVAYHDSRLNGRRLWLAGLLGGLASLLHPWNGELLIAIVVAAEAVMALGRRYDRAHVKLTIATLAGTGVPLLYYAILGKTDLSWKLAQVASKHAFSFWSITIAIVPLLVPAAVAYTRRPTTFLAAATRTLAAGGVRDLRAVGHEPRRDAPALLPGDHDPAGGARRRGVADHRLVPASGARCSPARSSSRCSRSRPRTRS